MSRNVAYLAQNRNQAADRYYAEQRAFYGQQPSNANSANYSSSYYEAPYESGYAGRSSPTPSSYAYEASPYAMQQYTASSSYTPSYYGYNARYGAPYAAPYAYNYTQQPYGYQYQQPYYAAQYGYQYPQQYGQYAYAPYAYGAQYQQYAPYAYNYAQQPYGYQYQQPYYAAQYGYQYPQQYGQYAYAPYAYGQQYQQQYAPYAYAPNYAQPQQEYAYAPYTPYVDIYDTKKSVEVYCDMPGCREDDIEVYYYAGQLTISAKSYAQYYNGYMATPQKTEGQYLAAERAPCQYQRSIAIDADVEVAKIKSSYENGVLTVYLPKTKESAGDGRRVTVTAAE